MEEKKVEKNDEISFDLQRIFGALLNKAWLIAIVAVLCAALTLIGTIFLVTPKYDSKVMFYVNNSSLSVGDVNVDISSADITASRSLVKSYIVILNTRETLNDVIDYAGVNRSVSSVRDMISADAVNSTEIFEVVVSCENPAEAEQIASAIAYILPKRIDHIIDGTSAKIVDSAVVPTAPSSPNYTTNTIIGFLVGMLAVCAVIVLREIFDITIRTEEDVIQVTGSNTILTAVPNMNSSSKSGGYYSGYRKPYSTDKNGGGDAVLIGSGVNFAASEAYKLLRTKLQFSFADESKCHVIGVSSALAGEGKSLTAVNLSYSLSQLGKRVLLIDCDMRCPSVAEKLNIPKAPGLSEFLSSQATEDKLIQYCGIRDDERAFHVIVAGRVPPNPMELLSSKRMEKALEKLRQSYDYLILDLPPVAEVGDALTATTMADGMLLVVRQNYCNRLALAATLHQFESIGGKILGMVFNYTSDENATYGYKKYLHRYYKQYGHGSYYNNQHYRRYGGKYAHAAAQAREESAAEAE